MATITSRGTGITQTGWTNPANAYDAGTSTLATWASTTANATSTIYITGYGFSSIPAGSTINSVSAVVKQYVSATNRMVAPKVQAYVSTTAKGSQTTLTNSTSSSNSQTVTLTGLTQADLVDANFRMQFIATHYNGTVSGTQNLDYIELTVDYTAPVLGEGTVSGGYGFAGTASGANGSSVTHRWMSDTPTWTPADFTDGTPNITLGNTFYTYSGASGTVTGARIYLPSTALSGISCTIFAINNWPTNNTGGSINLNNAANYTTSAQGTITGSGWFTVTFPSSFAVTSGTPFFIGYYFGNKDNGRYVAGNVGTTGFVQATDGYNLALSESTAAGGFERSYYQIGSVTTSSPSDGWYGTDVTLVVGGGGEVSGTGTASGGFDYTGAATGSEPASGASTGGYGFAGATTGVTTKSGTASGGFSEAGAATGSILTSATAAGGYGFAGTASASTLFAGTTSGGVGFAGSSIGSAPAGGSAQGGYAYAGTASGAIIISGSGSGGYGFAGSGTGAASLQGISSGGYGFAGSSAGTTVRTASVSGSYGFAGTSAGAIERTGSTSGGYGFAGAASGTTSYFGTSSGGYGFAGSTQGGLSTSGTSAGGYAFTGASAGARISLGGAGGGVGFAGASTGAITTSGQITGTYGFAGTSGGVHLSVGTSTGGFTLVGAATGSAPLIAPTTGVAAGAISFDGLSQGARSSTGGAGGEFSFVGFAIAHLYRDVRITLATEPAVVVSGTGPNNNTITGEILDLAWAMATPVLVATTSAPSSDVTMSGAAPDNEWESQACATLWEATAPEN